MGTANNDYTKYEPNQSSTTYIYNNGSPSVVVDNNPSKIPVRTRTVRWGRVSSKTPGYGAHHFPNGLPMNPYSYLFWEDFYITGTSMRKTKKSYGYTISTYTGSTGAESPVPLGFSSSEWADLSQRAKQKCLLKAKDQDVNAAQAYAERSQTIRLVKDTMERLGRSMHALRRGNFAAAANALGISTSGAGSFSRAYRNNQSKAIAKGWLELQYGWRPLLSDVYGSVDALNKLRQKRKPLIRVSSKQTLNKTDKTVGDNNHATQYVWYESEASVKVVLYYAQSQPLVTTLKELGITNPALLAWELLPFSFVADWFIPIGSFLSTFDAGAGLRFVKGCETTFELRKSHILREATNRVEGDFTYAESNVGSKKMLSIGRLPYASAPLPSIPGFKDPLSAEHLANAAALLKLNFKR